MSFSITSDQQHKFPTIKSSIDACKSSNTNTHSYCLIIGTHKNSILSLVSLVDVCGEDNNSSYLIFLYWNFLFLIKYYYLLVVKGKTTENHNFMHWICCFLIKQIVDIKKKCETREKKRMIQLTFISALSMIQISFPIKIVIKIVIKII